MSPSPYISHYVELLVPSAETEQEFLLLAVHAAVKKYRAAQHQNADQPQLICDEGSSLQEQAC